MLRKDPLLDTQPYLFVRQLSGCRPSPRNRWTYELTVERDRQTGAVLQAASQAHGFTRVIECLVRQAEQPFDEAAVSQAADAGIMASVLELMRDVPNRIVEGEASFCVVATSGELGDAGSVVQAAW